MDFGRLFTARTKENGIEYAVLQLLAESYFLMKRGLHLSHGEITEAFKGWKASLLGSYLLDSSIRVLEKKDRDGLPLVEKILDFGQQKGTGKWTLEDALERDVYIPTIFEAVYARSFSADRNLRKRGCERLKSSGMPYEMENYEEKLRDALLLGIISSYAQGMTLIAKASEDSGWDMDMGVLASIWRGGCVIRSDLLPQVGQALTEQEENLLLTDTFSGIKGLEPALREVVTKAQSAAIAVPAFTSVLNYYDYLHMEQLPVNFVQALRDCFGAHTYQRVDQDGWFHTEWE